MRYVAMHSLPPTPPEDCDDPLALMQPLAGLSLDLGLSNTTPWTPSFTSNNSPPSYDPMSPSYDPCAASPCNPFPTSSPFATFTFVRPKASSRLRFEDMCDFEVLEPSATTQTPQSPHQRALPAATLSHIPPPHSAPSLRRTKLCRFYLDPAGCKSGRWCNFKHPVGARSDRTSDEPASLEELRAAVVRSRIVKGTSAEDTSRWDDVPDVRDVDPNWGKKEDGEVHPKWRTQPCRNFLLGLCRYGDKCQFIHAPGLFPPNTTDIYPLSLPIPVPVDASAAVSASLPLPVSVWGPHPGIGTVTSACSPDGSTTTKAAQMSLYYRTKPCKYFDADGTCPHGADCKFIHDPNKSTPSDKSSVTSPPSVARNLSWADDDRELDFEKAPQFSGMDVDVDESVVDGESAMQDVTNEDAHRTSSMRRRDRARARNASRDASRDCQRDTRRNGGIFKPLWRVVGGGVMLANGQKRPEQDFSFPRIQNDEDVVLDRQPRDLHRLVAPALPDDSPIDYAHASPFTSDTTTSLFTDDCDYNYDYASFSIDPAQYPPNELLRAPSPADSLNISMGRVEVWDSCPAPLAPRKKRIVTGADLMRGITGGTAEDSPLDQPESRRIVSPSKERERQKPRLTIAVPALTSPHTHRRTQSYGVKGPAGYTPYPHPQPRRAIAAEAKLATRTDAGDDVLDWGEDDDDVVGVTPNRLGIPEANVEDIRRVRSTPPTPRSSASYLDVPVMPKLPAESP